MILECFRTNTGIQFEADGLRAIGLEPQSLLPEVFEVEQREIHDNGRTMEHDRARRGQSPEKQEQAMNAEGISAIPTSDLRPEFVRYLSN